MEDIDLTKDIVDENVTTEYVEKNYDPRPREDFARIAIALTLVALLSIILISSLAILAFDPDKADAIDGFMQLVLSPLVALVSAATGFYFGSKK